MTAPNSSSPPSPSSPAKSHSKRSKTAVPQAIPAAVPSRWERPAFLAALAVMFVTTGLFYYFWRIGYTSDTAMGSLMSKSVVERGERPIFYWQVGYQGTLEVYATALFFKLFGAGPRVANLWQMLCFWGMQALFFVHVRKLYGFWIAVWASVFFTLSTPRMYMWVMRPQPNYTEIFVMGLALFIIAQQLIDRYYVREPASLPKGTLGLWAAAGLLFGFGLYTYGQIVYFVAAIAVQLGLMLLRELPGRVRWRGPVGAGLGLTALPVLWILAVGLTRYLGDIPTAEPFSTRMPTVDCIKQGIEAAVAWGALLTLAAFPRALKRVVPGVGVMLLGFVIGWSPQIYYSWILKAPARDRTALSGTLEMGLRRLGWGWDGLSLFFGTDAVPYTRLLMGLVVLAPVVAYGWHVGRHAWRFVRRQLPRRAALSPGAMAWLPMVLLPMFALTHAVEDIWSARYLMVMWFWFCTAFAWCLMQAWESAAKSIKLRAACVAAAGFMLVHNAVFLGQSIAQEEQKGFSGEKAIAAMKERGVKYGYAYYWYAYAIDFYTQEELILEPIVSAYCPHYRQAVGQAARFAFVDEAKSFRQHLQMLGPYWGSNVRVTDVWEDDGVAMAVLERGP